MMQRFPGSGSSGEAMARHWLIIWGVLIFLLGAGGAGAAELELFKAERFQGGPWRIRAET
jgi:hypothetical protein